MSAVPRNILLAIQEDCYSRILANAFLSTVAVVLERRAVTEEEVKKTLSALNTRGGKIGVAILVAKPLVIPESDNPNGRAQIVQPFTVLEHPTLNHGDKGTGITAEEIAVELFDLFHMAAVSRPEQVFSGFPGGAIGPENSFPGINGWEVRMRTFASLRRTARTATPLITPDEGAAPQTIAITAAPGASIYYTTDRSYPCSGNAAATLYTVPFEQTTAAVVRAVAEQTGYQPSNIAEATFT